MNALLLAIERVRVLTDGYKIVWRSCKIVWRTHMDMVQQLERQSFGFEFLRDEIHILDNCMEEECQICAVLHCPELEPLHFHHDGCPVCGLDRELDELDEQEHAL